MKVGKISVGNSSPDDDRSLEQFASEPAAESPLGKLLLELIKTVWSGDCTVYAHFGREQSFLQIEHPAFLSNASLRIHGTSGIVSVRNVEDAIHTHVLKLKADLQPAIWLLNERVNALDKVSFQIKLDKARAAIGAVYPEVADAKYYATKHNGDLVGFISKEGSPDEKLFFTRRVGGEFVGGAVRLNMPWREWHALEEGFFTERKHGVFWSALARAFAASELNVPEDSFHCKIVFAEENHAWPRPAVYDPFIVEKVVLELPDMCVEVEFINNLPAEVTPVPKRQVA